MEEKDFNFLNSYLFTVCRWVCFADGLQGVLYGNDFRLGKPWKSKPTFFMSFCHCHDKNFLLAGRELYGIASYLLLS